MDLVEEILLEQLSTTAPKSLLCISPTPPPAALHWRTADEERAVTDIAPADALEKRPARAPDRDAWTESSTVTIGYYNICTGWVWVWSGWSAGSTDAALSLTEISLCSGL